MRRKSPVGTGLTAQRTRRVTQPTPAIRAMAVRTGLQPSLNWHCCKC
ncbi:hypothetical protein SAMN05216359_10683 [Roseateles sp. YR242]|nr:hypothetical protein SAMN05216359_10683 [Roseateles sp. YR242]